MSDKIVSIFSKPKKEQSYCVECRECVAKANDGSCSKCGKTTYSVKSKEESFEEIMRKNLEKQERMKKDRAKANKGVIRSYRLKPR